LELKYEEMIGYLNQLPRTDFFTREEIVQKYYKIINKYKVTKTLLNQFNKEANAIRKMSKQRINTLKRSKDVFTCYIKSEGKYATITFSS